MSSSAEVAGEGRGRYLTVRQVADQWQVSSTTVYRLITTGALAAVEISERTYRIAQEAVDRYERRHEIPTPRENDGTRN